jgi:hypothetical protein
MPQSGNARLKATERLKLTLESLRCASNIAYVWWPDRAADDKVADVRVSDKKDAAEKYAGDREANRLTPSLTKICKVASMHNAK